MEAVGGAPVGSLYVVEPLLLRLDLVVPDRDHAGEDDAFNWDQADVAGARFLADGTPVDVLVDVVDAVLDLMPVPPGSPDFAVNPPAGRPRPTGWELGPRPRPFVDRRSDEYLTELRGELARLLCDALSALRVRADGRGLERRSGIGTEEAFREAVKSAAAVADAGSAAAHLREAWGCAYALHPDPGKTYGEAIKAVEAAAHAVLLPADAIATLGKTRGDLRANRDKFALMIGGPDGRGDVSPLLDCISLLWDGQTSRHGSRRPT